MHSTALMFKETWWFSNLITLFKFEFEVQNKHENKTHAYALKWAYIQTDRWPKVWSLKSVNYPLIAILSLVSWMKCREYLQVATHKYQVTV